VSILSEKRMFPCPVCMTAREVKITKKDKPYIVCDPCGVQVFVRGPAGIQEFERLLERGSRNGALGRLEEMEKRYRLSCPECGHGFWMERSLIKTSNFDGSFKGFRCPECREIVPWEENQ